MRPLRDFRKPGEPGKPNPFGFFRERPDSASAIGLSSARTAFVEAFLMGAGS